MSKKKKNELPTVKSTEELTSDRDLALRVMADESKLMDLQTRDVEAARKIFECKKAHPTIINGRPEYESVEDYHRAITERESVTIERMELQLKDDRSRFNSRLKNNESLIEHFNKLLEARNEEVKVNVE